MRRLGLLARLAMCASLGLVGCNGEIISSGGSGDSERGRGPGGSSPGGSNSGSGFPGDPNNPAGPGGNGDPNNPAAPSAEVPCPPDASETPGRRVLRRLTGKEIERTIRSVFGLDQAAWAGLAVPPDPASLDGFNNNVDRLTVGSEFAKGTLSSAREVAGLVIDDTRLPTILPCANAGGPPCADTYLKTIGKKLYRRPMTIAEEQRFMDLYIKISEEADFKTWVYWATLTMLQSPHVLYRSELGEPAAGGNYKLTGHEIASALSYTFTGGPPSAELLAEAMSGRLSTPDQIEAQARKLIYDENQALRPEFREILLNFADQWVGLSTLQNLKKDEMAFPMFTQAVQEAMTEETRRFLTQVLIEEKGTPADLLTAPYTFANETLSHFYGFTPVAGQAFQKVTRPPGWGIGLLAQGSTLAIESHSLDTSPTKRGYFVRTRLLCGVVPPPPPVVSELPEPTGAETTRQRYEKLHVADESCRACHQLIDPIGFAFEHLDATGRYRERENGFDIDDSGVLTQTGKGDLPFQGPEELARTVASLPETAECLASYVASYAFGVQQKNASCLVRSATEELRKGMSVVDFYLRMARSPHFRTRLP